MSESIEKDQSGNNSKNNNKTCIYSKLKSIAQDAHKSMFDFGLEKEMGLIYKYDSSSNRNEESILKDEKRKELQEIGRR